MALQSSGAISIKNVQDEFSPTGGTGASGIKFSEYYRDGSIISNDLVGGSIPNSAGQPPISMSQFRGAADYSTVTISGGNRTNSNLRSLADAAGFNGTNPVRITLQAGYHLATSTSNYGMRTGSFPSELKVDNYAYIMGKGGTGGQAPSAGGSGGGHALLLDTNVTSWSNLSNGTCSAGGGGGGSGRYRDGGSKAAAAGGGGGAGGGDGGRAASASGTTGGGAGSNSGGGSGNNGGIRHSSAGTAEGANVGGRGGSAAGGGGGWGRDQNKGNTTSATAGAGGGGGRAFPGSGGSGGSNPGTANPGGSGGSSTNGGGGGSTATGGGGGGWGASGGGAGGGGGGGGGRAVHRNGNSISHNNNRFHGSIAG